MTPIDPRRRALAVFAVLAVTGLAAPAVAQAKARKTKSSRTRKDKSDAETQKQKDARLTRECKGRPNAGACLGYAN